jgi:hypothetical protein
VHCALCTTVQSVSDRCILAGFLTAKAAGSFLDQISGNYYQQRNNSSLQLLSACRVLALTLTSALCHMPFGVHLQQVTLARCCNLIPSTSWFVFLQFLVISMLIFYHFIQTRGKCAGTCLHALKPFTSFNDCRACGSGKPTASAACMLCTSHRACVNFWAHPHGAASPHHPQIQNQ